MDIAPESLVKYSELDIIAHCLWEMTFCGFTQKLESRQGANIRRAMKAKNLLLEVRKNIVECI